MTTFLWFVAFLVSLYYTTTVGGVLLFLVTVALGIVVLNRMVRDEEGRED